MKLATLFVLLSLAALALGSPIWKVFCGAPLYKGRVDPIVNPGKYSGHTHEVSGANHFNPSGTNQTAMDVYNDLRTSSCTTCSIGVVDLSVYWHPDLYYQWPNGTFSVVPYSGLTVYYLSREPAHGYNSSIPNNKVWTPIPKGLRMLAGNPFRRSYNGTLEEQAVNYACLPASGGLPETNGFPTAQNFCANGLRAQVFFPMCWDGVHLDSADHKSHMAYPSNYNGGDCPATHPVRIPGVFFEAMYSVANFPHGNGTNPFVWSCGDPTGYGFHGDFLNGWDEDVMAAAISDPTCDISNQDLAFGNNVKACAPLSAYVQGGQPQGACNLARPIPLTEDLGISNIIPSLPGCNPITYGPATATPCSKAPNATAPTDVTLRFHLRSLVNNMFVTAPPNITFPMLAQVNGSTLTYYEVWDAVPVAAGVGLYNEAVLQYVSASGSNNSQLFANRGSANLWETFQIIPQPDKGANVVALLSFRETPPRYVRAYSNGGLFPVATNITASELFELVPVTGGWIGVDGVNVVPFPNPTNNTVTVSTSGRSSTTSANSLATNSASKIGNMAAVLVCLLIATLLL